MSGMVFLKTQRLADLREFYLQQVGCEVWLERADCLILRNGNLLFGFCERDDVDEGALLTFFYQSRADVDRIYDSLKSIAVSPPAGNDKYNIYHFFARDPEGRTIEFQCFDHPVCSHLSGDELLLSRRSIREFKTEPIPEDILERVLDISRYAPTSRNTQSYYFKLIDQKETLRWLSEIREGSSTPIGKAPMAVAICADPQISKRHIQDGCIGAYHFMLAAWSLGLGTCWIAAMDREDVKERLNIPQSHYIATITPLGYPLHAPPPPPERKAPSEYVRS